MRLPNLFPIDLLLYFYLFILVFRDKLSLCGLGYLGTCSAHQAALKLRGPAASASSAGLKGVCCLCICLPLAPPSWNYDRYLCSCVLCGAGI